MVQKIINIGTTANDGTGDTLRAAFANTNNNFTELYNLTPVIYYTANDAYIVSNGAYSRANVAFDMGNAAYIISNSTIISFSTANLSYDKANAAYDLANASYIGSNSAVINANLAFNKANLAYDTAVQAFNTANTANNRRVYDIGGFVAGVTTNNEPILQYSVVRDFTIAANCSGSVGYSLNVATSTTVFTINKNFANVGTMIFTTGNSSATFNTSGNILYMNIGDFLLVKAPATPDATLSDFSFTFRGVLV